MNGAAEILTYILEKFFFTDDGGADDWIRTLHSTRMQHVAYFTLPIPLLLAPG